MEKHHHESFGAALVYVSHLRLCTYCVSWSMLLFTLLLSSSGVSRTLNIALTGVPRIDFIIEGSSRSWPSKLYLHFNGASTHQPRRGELLASSVQFQMQQNNSKTSVKAKHVTVTELEWIYVEGRMVMWVSGYLLAIIYCNGACCSLYWFTPLYGQIVTIMQLHLLWKYICELLGPFTEKVFQEFITME